MVGRVDPQAKRSLASPERHLAGSVGHLNLLDNGCRMH